MKSLTRSFLPALLLFACTPHDETAQHATTASDVGSGPSTDAGASAIGGDAGTSNAFVDAAAAPNDTANLESFDAGADPGDTWVRFERTACLGTCPMYTVLVGAHGAVRFSSRLFTRGGFVDGCASKNIGDQGVAALKSAIAKYGYFSLQNSYNGGPTDAPSTDMSVTMNHKTKVVHHYTGAPVRAADAQRLQAVEDAIDQISGAADFAVNGPLTPCKYTGN